MPEPIRDESPNRRLVDYMKKKKDRDPVWVTGSILDGWVATAVAWMVPESVVVYWLITGGK